MSKKVLMIRLRSDAVDFEKWPQLTKEKLEAAFVQAPNAKLAFNTLPYDSLDAVKRWS